MRRLLVYPFTLETVPLVRFKDGLVGYDAVIPVIEKGSKLTCNLDISYIDGGCFCGEPTLEDFKLLVADASGVLFSCDMRDIETGHDYISIAREHGKDILYCGNYSKDFENDFVGSQCINHPILSAESAPEDSLLEIPVPTITVAGQGQQCDKFNIQMGLGKTLRELGYNVSQVGTKSYCALFGIHPLPQIPDAPLWKKIILYNRFFREVVEKEKPDVLIVGVPGGIMPIDGRHNELFGETAIAISKSLRPDISIHSMYYGKVDNDYLSNTISYAKYALDSPFDYFHLSSTKLVVEQDLRTISYLTTDSSRVFEIQDNIDDRFFNVFSDCTSAAVYRSVVSRLQNNIETL